MLNNPSNLRIGKVEPKPAYALVLLHAFSSCSKSARELLELFADYDEFLYALRANDSVLSNVDLTAAKIDALQRPDWGLIGRTLAWANDSSANQHIIAFNSSDYPVLLKEIDAPPLVLFIKGDKEILHRPQLAVVGSRNPTPLGLDNAHVFANQAARLGLVVTSGLAIGVDAAAHRGALACHGGRTIAVMGAGLHHIYPQRHQLLAQEIVANGGTLVSEFPLHVAPLAANFPQRNRIISGLSLGTLVVEATMRSGSLITARLAAEQGREVFAIPNSIHNPLAHGCHVLIRQGAKLVENIADILEELPPLSIGVRGGSQLENASLQPNIALQSMSADVSPNAGFDAAESAANLSALHRKLLACIGYEATSIDVMAQRSSLTISEITTILLPLELMGCIKKAPGGYIRCV